MAHQKFRPMYPGVFTDPHLRRYPLEKHFFFLALIGNPETTISGIYPIALDILAKYGRCSEEQALQWLREGMRNISFDEDNMCIFVHNALRYRLKSQGGNPEWVAQALASENQSIKTPLWIEFCEVYNIPTTPTPPHYTITTLHYTRLCKRICKPSVKDYKRKEEPFDPRKPASKRLTDLWWKLTTPKETYKQALGIFKDLLGDLVSGEFRERYREEDLAAWLPEFLQDTDPKIKDLGGHTLGVFKHWLSQRQAQEAETRVDEEKKKQERKAIEESIKRGDERRRQKYG